MDVPLEETPERPGAETERPVTGALAEEPLPEEITEPPPVEDTEPLPPEGAEAARLTRGGGGATGAETAPPEPVPESCPGEETA